MSDATVTVIYCIVGFFGACAIAVGIGLSVKRLRSFLDWLQSL